MTDIDKSELKQEGYPDEIAAEVYKAKRRATDMFHNDHDDGDTAIYQLLAELAPLITQQCHQARKDGAEPYKKMLEKLGTEKCPHCKDFMIDDDMNICESCNYGVHEWCTGYTYDGDGEYPAESAYAICKDCFDKAQAKETEKE